jgi:streptogramin lyase
MASGDGFDRSRKHVRIFISSPADVRPERLLAERIIARLDREFSYRFHVTALLWERQPLVASHHFQDPRNIPPPSSSEIVIMILWSRLGVMLPEADFRGPISGRPVTGTEWEFEDALAGYEQHGVPELLLYRKEQPVTVTLDDGPALEEKRRQWRMVNDFVARWFGGEGGGGFKAALTPFGTAEEFEQKLYEHLRTLLERRVEGSDTSAVIRWHEAPFRGLLSFEVQHSAVFFGRTRARNEVRELLASREARGCAFVIVLGASGSGKSSLIKAGVLPDLMLPGMIGLVALCRYAVMRPSDDVQDVFGALATALLSETALAELAGMRYTKDRLAALLREAPHQAVLPIEQGLAAARRGSDLTEIAQARLVLIVDQMEELFTSGIGEADRTAFVRALDSLSRCGLVWVLATMRSDFFDRLDESAALSLLADGDARYLLQPPGDAELGQIIRAPAHEAGLRFEADANGVALDDVVRESAGKGRNSLPLLSFLLDELWRRRTERGVLTFAAYDGLGGFEGALARRAEDVFTAQAEEVRAALGRVLRALVRIGREGQIAAKVAPLAAFAVGSPERRLVDAFAGSDARLFVLSAALSGTPEAHVRVAHEALFTHWARARQSIELDRSDLEIEERLTESAARWQRAAPEARASLLLQSGLPIEEAKELLARRGAELAAQLHDFVDASTAAERARNAEAERMRRERLQEQAELERTRANAAERVARTTRRFLVVVAAVALLAVIAGTFGLRFARATSNEKAAAITVNRALRGALKNVNTTLQRNFNVTFKEFPASPASNSKPYGIVTGPDGALWYSENGTNKIGRMTTHGEVTEYALPAAYNDLGPEDIIVGPDRALWFAHADRIGRISTSGSVKEFTLEDGNPEVLVSGPDDAVWFTQNPYDRIGRITMSGKITNFRLSGDNSERSASGIAVGPDGLLWFSDNGWSRGARSYIGKIVAREGDRLKVREFTVPSESGEEPRAIVPGPDGGLWFSLTGFGASSEKIGRISIAGKLQAFPVDALLLGGSLTFGGDRALWFTDAFGRVGRMTLTGTVAQFPSPSDDSDPQGITVGPDGAIWFTEPAAGKIVRLHFGKHR